MPQHTSRPDSHVIQTQLFRLGSSVSTYFNPSTTLLLRILGLSAGFGLGSWCSRKKGLKQWLRRCSTNLGRKPWQRPGGSYGKPPTFPCLLRLDGNFLHNEEKEGTVKKADEILVATPSKRAMMGNVQVTSSPCLVLNLGPGLHEHHTFRHLFSSQHLDLKRACYPFK